MSLNKKCPSPSNNSAPIYDIQKSYAENLMQGPSFSGVIPERMKNPESEWLDFLGYKVASPLGVPAGPLLNSQWTYLASQLGFDVVTYKTIRSQAYTGYPLPNVIYVEQCSQNPQIAFKSNPPQEVSQISITNSFGMPSMSEAYLQEDIAKARNQLSKGQVLIVSVVGTAGFSSGIPEDFVRAALIAKEAGAQVIEANFSCPNISTKEGSLYCDPESSFLTASLLAKAISPLPLLIKVGRYSNSELLKKVLIGLARANVRAVCGINSVSMKVLNEQRESALGKKRETSGVCGNLIRSHALEFVQEASRIINEESLNLELIGCGGIMDPSHFDQFLEAGAKIAMTATGMMWDPYLAVKWQNQKEKNHAH
jgi:dihydroorotate dehydrogenase (NAD+) catalytic subunit